MEYTTVPHPSHETSDYDWIYLGTTDVRTNQNLYGYEVNHGKALEVTGLRIWLEAGNCVDELQIFGEGNNVFYFPNPRNLVIIIIM